MLKGEGEYNLDVLEETVVTDSYLGLDQKIRDCQNDEPALNSITLLNGKGLMMKKFIYTNLVRRTLIG